MTQEEKSFFLKDLCARVPYHPKGHVVNACNGAECDEWLTCATFSMFTNVVNNCRLYLRPMSSMTDEEKEEFEELFIGYSISRNRNCVYHARRGDLRLEIIDWLNAHHFDYRGLIKMGLALEAPNEIYNN